LERSEKERVSCEELRESGSIRYNLRDGGPWNLKRIEELSRSDAERPSEAQDVHEGNVPLAPFDSTDVISVQVRQFGEFLLGEISLETEPANVISENSSGVGGRHTAII
jgi:hypothetical protein